MKRALWVLGIVAGGCDVPGGRTTFDGTFDSAPDSVAADGATGAPDGANDAVPADVAGADDSAGTGICARWLEARGQLDEGAWTGSSNSCEAGEYLEPGPTNTLRLLNLYRSMAALPPVNASATKSADAQACSLMMHANDEISHQVPTGWSCWSQRGASTAGLSNLATTAAVLAIDLYMTDQDVDNLGHRRWLLANSLGPVGIGSTSEYSCLKVIDGDGDARARWTAWPPAGEVPIQALHIQSWADADAAGWSVQSDYIDLRAGEVTVTRDGEVLDTEVWTLDEGYGSSFGLGIRPRGWRSAAGETYNVVVAGLSEPIAWSFTVVDCR